MDGDDGFFVECDGNTSLHEQSNFEPWAKGAPCGYRGPLSPDEAEAIRLHNLLCRPAPETQAVDRSPVESVPVAKIRELEAHIREVVRLTHIGGRSFGTATALEWADELERIGGDE